MLDKFVPAKGYSTQYNPLICGLMAQPSPLLERNKTKSKKKNNPDHGNDYHPNRAHRGHINTRLSNSLEENNTKPFWNYIMSLRNDSVGVAPIKHKVICIETQPLQDTSTKCSVSVSICEG